MLLPQAREERAGRLGVRERFNKIEQAGGKASDGKERILDIIPESPHPRRSFFVGNNHMVEDVENFIKAFPDA